MIIERWKITCPQKPYLAIIANDHPGVLCPVCKKVRGFENDECRGATRDVSIVTKNPDGRTDKAPRPKVYEE